MSERGRSTSPRPLRDAEMAVDSEKPNAKVVIVTNLTRNVVKAHLQVIFGVYGDVAKIDLPVYGKSGQNRGKAAVEYAESQAARKAASHMDGGQLDGAVLKVELSDLPAQRGRRRLPWPGDGTATATKGLSPPSLSQSLKNTLKIPYPSQELPSGTTQKVTQLHERWIRQETLEVPQLLRALQSLPYKICLAFAFALPLPDTVNVLFFLFEIQPQQKSL
ncbi:hypothetical protein PLEOSDRAFT_1103140 [Pleurotus ostreatus PC15]|uniref:RRM domain-containing protein n=1 Tax=Pleurotus ostreatus (strain PC15) TaxID=1137138 RepID=A0A067NZQ3_PLEO1|nr:hypothetical protein PLEOSDRAFT_1103140 [Pleurotus ostreatus PC15]